MTSLERPGAWIVAAFVAGSGAGAAGLHWVTQTDAQRAPSSTVASSSPGQQAETEATPSEGALGGASIDREALRAALAELLAEEAASRNLEEEDTSLGESASEALMRLERAYRAELEEQVRRARDEEIAALDAPESSERDVVRADRSAPGTEPADVEETRDVGEPRADDRAALPVEDRTAENQRGVERDDEAAARPPEGERVAVVTQVQPLFFAPVGLPPAALGTPAPPGAQVPRSPMRSPLSKPLRSAHEESPWSPIDYSRHHNPWGPTFGRRVP